jgi:hypothetical protein
MDERARRCTTQTAHPLDLALLLTREVIGGVYSYGNAAPETLPCAFVLAQAHPADPVAAATVATTIARSADSLPSLVGALAGAQSGIDSIPPLWRQALQESRGICLPMLGGVRLAEIATRLATLTA